MKLTNGKTVYILLTYVDYMKTYHKNWKNYETYQVRNKGRASTKNKFNE